MIIVRELAPSDRPGWEQLWAGYLDFYRTTLEPLVTDVLWQRLNDPSEPMFALVAEESGVLVGFVHCVLHRGTWSIGDLCYIEDLYVRSDRRGGGVGRALIEAVYARADKIGWDRVHWLTHDTNETARRLYDKLATHGGFIHYRRQR